MRDDGFGATKSAKTDGGRGGYNDWAKRDDGTMLGRQRAHGWLGLVAYFPMRFDTNSVVDEQSAKSWYRVRVMRVNSKHNTVTVYLYDHYQDYETAQELEMTGKVVKGKPSRSVPLSKSAGFRLAVVKVDISNFERKAIFLSPRDVVDNDEDMFVCQVCAGDINPGDQKRCDGFYPLAKDDPIFRCRGGAVHTGCASKVTARSLNLPASLVVKPQSLKSSFDKGKNKTDLWLCKRCRGFSSSTPTHEQLFGFNIVYPSPVSSSLTVNPRSTVTWVDSGEALDGTAFDIGGARATRQSEGHVRFGSSSMAACAELEILRRNENFGMAQFTRVIQSFHRAVAAISVRSLEGQLPHTAEAVASRGGYLLPSQSDTPATEINVSVTELLQTQKFASLSVRDPPQAAVQEILLDKNFDAEDYCIVGVDSAMPNPCYVNKEGEKIYGPDVHHCDDYRALEETVPSGSPILMLTFWSDKTGAGKHVIHNVKVRLDNLRQSKRLTPHATRTIAAFPMFKVRKPRGGRAEGMSEDQRIAKLAAISWSIAKIMASFEAGAKNGVLHQFRKKDGSTVVRLAHYRLMAYYGDLVEGFDLNAVSAGSCPRCLFKVPRMKCGDNDDDAESSEDDGDEGDEGQVSRRHADFSQFKTNLCGDSRTVEGGNSVRRSYFVARNVLHGMKTQAEVMVRKLGTRPRVENQVCRLVHFVRHELGGFGAMFRIDVLHFFFLGLVTKLLSMVLALIERTFEKSSTLRTFEDIRQLISERFQRMIPFPGLAVFDEGFWATEFGTKGPGADGYEAYFLQFYVAIGGCSILIPDLGHRQLVRSQH